MYGGACVFMYMRLLTSVYVCVCVYGFGYVWVCVWVELGVHAQCTYVDRGQRFASGETVSVIGQDISDEDRLAGQ